MRTLFRALARSSRAEIPDWLTYLIYSLIALVIILGLYSLLSGKLSEFLQWFIGGF